ncbi:MAG: TRAP transporter substrate-binding protein DctP [Pyramidobacter sp.]|jgi:TRAP-type C4-dicarboxylate transport system substrate-binding protein
MKKISIAMLVGVLCLAAPLYAAEKSYNWKISTIRPAGTAIDKDVHAFIDEIKEKSNGRINIEIYPNAQLGDYTVVQERISVGSVEMAVQSISTSVDRQLQMVNLPYLVKDWNGIRKNYRSGSAFMNWLSDRLARQNIKLLGMWPSYFGGIALAKEPPSPGDPSVKKGLKVRVMPQKSYELLGESQGYMATPLPLAETFTALQTGIVDGIFGAGAEGYYANYRDLVKYYIPSNTHVEAWPLIMNLELWDSLSDGDKKIIQEAAKHLEDHRMEVGEADTAYNEKRLEDYGAKIIRLTPEELTVCAEAARKAIFPVIREAIGAKNFDAVVKMIEE